MRARIFRYLVATVILLAVPPFVLCSSHHCMGGHMEHGPYSWIDYASHWTYLYLIIAIFPLALLGDLPERRVLYAIALVAWAALFIFPGPPVALGLTATACYVVRQTCTDSGNKYPKQPETDGHSSGERDDDKK